MAWNQSEDAEARTRGEAETAARRRRSRGVRTSVRFNVQKFQSTPKCLVPNGPGAVKRTKVRAPRPQSERRLQPAALVQTTVLPDKSGVPAACSRGGASAALLRAFAVAGFAIDFRRRVRHS